MRRDADSEGRKPGWLSLLLQVSGLSAGLDLGPKGPGYRVLCPFSARAAPECYSDLKELKSC